MNSETMLYQLTETSKFMMSFVIVTRNNNCIVIDGGRKEDMPLLKEYVGGRHISAWILTHATQTTLPVSLQNLLKTAALILILNGFATISLPSPCWKPHHFHPGRNNLSWN